MVEIQFNDSIGRRIDGNQHGSDKMENIEEIKRALKKLGFEKSEIDMEESDSGKIGGIIISKLFEGMSQLERQNYIWDHLEKELNEEQHNRIRLILTLTPEESDEDELEAA